MYSSRRRLMSLIRGINIKGSGKVSYALAKSLMPLPKGPTTILTNYNFAIKVDPAKDNGVERALFYFGTYEKGTLGVMAELLKPGNRFVDIGANIGLMSMFASYCVGPQGHVTSFEPNPVTRAILQENIAMNGIQNIKVEAMAISAERKSSKIYDRWDVNRGGASLIKPNFETDSYDIEEISLTEYFPANTHIDLIKIDVEGYELEALKGAAGILQQPDAPMLIVECSLHRVNTFGETAHPLMDYIQQIQAYRIFKSVKGKDRISKLVEVKVTADLPDHDNIYCFTAQHLAKLPTALFVQA